MNYTIYILVTAIANILSLLIIVDSLLSWFLAPFHPIRQALGRVLQPMYAPIRRLIPPAGGFDLTPLVLLILIQVLEQIIVSLLR